MYCFHTNIKYLHITPCNAFSTHNTRTSALRCDGHTNDTPRLFAANSGFTVAWTYNRITTTTVEAFFMFVSPPQLYAMRSERQQTNGAITLQLQSTRRCDCNTMHKRPPPPPSPSDDTYSATRTALAHRSGSQSRAVCYFSMHFTGACMHMHN